MFVDSPMNLACKFPIYYEIFEESSSSIGQLGCELTVHRGNPNEEYSEIYRYIDCYLYFRGSIRLFLQLVHPLNGQ